MKQGMIIDGIAANQYTDKGGQVLDIRGCDISTLEREGVLNWEHRGADPKEPHSAEDIVGRVIFVKKILSENDCSSDREKYYWDYVRVPFIYFAGELFDQDGHDAARELAAIFRHYHDRDLPIVVRYSIQGKNILVKGNYITKSFARQVACTIKPCNSSCISGLVQDSTAQKEVDEAKVELDSLVKSEDPTKVELASQTMVFSIMDEPGIEDLKKAISAGGGDVAPSFRAQGEALVKAQRADLVLRKIYNAMNDIKAQTKSSHSLADAWQGVVKAKSGGFLSEEQFDKLRLALFEDELVTGIGNKRAHLEWAAKPRSGAFLCIDANDFKKINDTYGHEVGDCALVDIGTALKHAMTSVFQGFPQKGGKIHRIGGDEFFVHLPSYEHAEAFLCELKCFLDAKNQESSTYKLSLGVGVAATKWDAGQALIHRAKESKRAGSAESVVAFLQDQEGTRKLCFPA